METSSSGENMLRSVLEQMKSSVNARLVFGEPQTVGDKIIVPVAKVFYSFGAGEGSSPESETAAAGRGGGGGGFVNSSPVAVVEITPLQTRVIPIVDVTRFLMRMLMVWAFIACMVMMNRRKREHSFRPRRLKLPI